MNVHRNARTTPYARALIVERHAAGETVAAIAAAFGISVRTVYKWLARYRAGGRDALETRASAPRRFARMIDRRWQDIAVRLRRTCRLTAAGIADRLRLVLG